MKLKIPKWHQKLLEMDIVWEVGALGLAFFQYNQLTNAMKTHVEFRSSAFPPYDDEGEVNPGLYGLRVAEFLALGLKGKGFEPLLPVAEDWGWIVPIKNDDFNLWIGCGNYDEYPEDGFLCFIEPHQRLIRRWLLWTVDTSAKVIALQEAMDRLLSANPTIRDKKWWTYDEFNHTPPK